MADWPTIAAQAAAEGAIAAARAAAAGRPATDWICDRGGLHDRGAACDCAPDDDDGDDDDV